MKIRISQNNEQQGTYYENPEFEELEIFPRENAEVSIFAIHHYAGKVKSSLIKRFNYNNEEELGITLGAEFDNARIEVDILDDEGDFQDSETFETRMSY